MRGRARPVSAKGLTFINMAENRHYSRAPIAEALIDLRVELPSHVSVQDLEAVGVSLKSQYPQRSKYMATTGTVRLGETASAEAQPRHMGFVFRSCDARYICQARLDGFTMSRLAPYESWEPFREEAKRLWQIYRSVAVPSRVTRIAVRYVNRLDLPLPLRDFRDYLSTAPEVASGLPQALSGFFMRLVIPQVDINGTLLLNEAIVDPAGSNVVSIVLDIDLFCTDDVPADEEGMWDFFEVLRRRKDEVFEACITDKTRELIQ